MTKKDKIILAASVSTAVILIGTVAFGAVICRKIYEKKYFSVN